MPLVHICRVFHNFKGLSHTFSRALSTTIWRGEPSGWHYYFYFRAKWRQREQTSCSRSRGLVVLSTASNPRLLIPALLSHLSTRHLLGPTRQDQHIPGKPLSVCSLHLSCIWPREWKNTPRTTGVRSEGLPRGFTHVCALLVGLVPPSSCGKGSPPTADVPKLIVVYFLNLHCWEISRSEHDWRTFFLLSRHAYIILFSTKEGSLKNEVEIPKEIASISSRA